MTRTPYFSLAHAGARDIRETLYPRKRLLTDHKRFEKARGTLPYNGLHVEVLFAPGTFRAYRRLLGN